MASSNSYAYLCCLAFEFKGLDCIILYLPRAALPTSVFSSLDKTTIAAMLFINMTLMLLLISVKGLMTPEQSPNIDCPVASLPLAFHISSSSQVQSALRLQTPSLSAVHISTTSVGTKRGAFVYPSTFSTVKSGPVMYGEKALRQLYQSGDVMADPVDILTPTATQSSQIAATSPLTTDSVASSTSISVSTHGNANTPNVQSQNLVSVPRPTKGSNVTPRPSTITSMSNIQDSKGNIVLTHGTITSSPSPAIASKPDLTSSMGTVTANSKSQASSPFSQALAFDPTDTLGSRSSAAVLESQASRGKAALVYGSNASPLDAEPTGPPPLTIGSQIITADGRYEYILPNGQTMAPDSATILDSGFSTIFLGLQSSGTRRYLVIDSSTSLKSLVAATPASSKIPPLLTIGGQTVTADSLGQYNIDGQILTPGGMVTVSSTVISLASDETDAVVGTRTEALGLHSTGALGSGPSVATRPDLTLGTQTLTSNSLGQYNIDGQTLTPGGAITISGTMISLASDENDVVVGTKTEALGPYITAGLHSGSNWTEVQQFQGRAVGARDVLRSSSMVVLVGFAVLLLL